MSRLIAGTLTVAAVVLVYWALGWVAQRALVFPAPPRAPLPPLGSAELVTLDQPAGPVEALFLPPAAGTPAPFPLIVFTHGNAELADYWVDQFGEPRSWGWGVLLVEYPGYGRSAGRPSEASIRAAVLAAFDRARRDPRVDPARIVAWGRSLGGGAAARLAAERPVAALVLESSFTSVRPLAARYLLPGPLVRDPFDNLRALRDYRGPLLVLHGTHDFIVPVRHGRALAAAVPGAELHELDCGHNDCPRDWRVVRRFLREHGLLRRPTPPP